MVFSAKDFFLTGFTGFTAPVKWSTFVGFNGVKIFFISFSFSG